MRRWRPARAGAPPTARRPRAAGWRHGAPAPAPPEQQGSGSDQAEAGLPASRQLTGKCWCCSGPGEPNTGPTHTGARRAHTPERRSDAYVRALAQAARSEAVTRASSPGAHSGSVGSTERYTCAQSARAVSAFSAAPADRSSVSCQVCVKCVAELAKSTRLRGGLHRR